MFSRAAAIFVAALPVFAAAVVLPRGSNQCNTGAIQCCNSLQQSSNPTAIVGALLSVVGANVGSATGQVGVTCSPLSLVGLNSNSCTAQPVCCENNSFNGVVALGCTPINIGA